MSAAELMTNVSTSNAATLAITLFLWLGAFAFKKDLIGVNSRLASDSSGGGSHEKVVHHRAVEQLRGQTMRADRPIEPCPGRTSEALASLAPITSRWRARFPRTL